MGLLLAGVGAFDFGGGTPFSTVYALKGKICSLLLLPIWDKKPPVRSNQGWNMDDTTRGHGVQGGIEQEQLKRGDLVILSRESGGGREPKWVWAWVCVTWGLVRGQFH